MTFDELSNLNQTLNNECLKREALKNRLEQDLIKEQKNLLDYKNDIEAYEKKKAVLVEASEEARKQSVKVFEEVTTNALQTILGDNLSLVIETGELNGNKTLDFYTKSKYESNEILVDPTSEDGGGVADIVALSSLIVMNSFLSDENDAPIILDEPTKFVSKGNAENVSKFLKEISETFGKQIIMVTHDGVSSKIADKAYEVTLDDNGNSIVTNVKLEEN